MNSLEAAPKKHNQFEGMGTFEAWSTIQGDYQTAIKSGNRQALADIWDAIEDFHDQFPEVASRETEMPGEMEILQGIVQLHPGNLAAKNRLDDLEDRRKNPDNN